MLFSAGKKSKIAVYL
jgi:hypothetical protein